MIMVRPGDLLQVHRDGKLLGWTRTWTSEVLSEGATLVSTPKLCLSQWAALELASGTPFVRLFQGIQLSSPYQDLQVRVLHGGVQLFRTGEPDTILGILVHRRDAQVSIHFADLIRRSARLVDEIRTRSHE